MFFILFFVLFFTLNKNFFFSFFPHLLRLCSPLTHCSSSSFFSLLLLLPSPSSDLLRRRSSPSPPIFFFFFFFFSFLLLPLCRALFFFFFFFPSSSFRFDYEMKFGEFLEKFGIFRIVINKIWYFVDEYCILFDLNGFLMLWILISDVGILIWILISDVGDDSGDELPRIGYFFCLCPEFFCLFCFFYAPKLFGIQVPGYATRRVFYIFIFRIQLPGYATRRVFGIQK